MHVAIVGAGALGSVYGARLALFGDCEVSVVARSAGPGHPERLERVHDGDLIEWNAPERRTEAPPGADVVLAFVRYEQLASLPARVASTAAPVVVMTPMMPRDHAELARALPGRLVAGMPSVVSYRNDAGVLRYWLPSAATTLVEERSPAGTEVELVARLGRADIRAKLDADVLARDVATTVSFMPLAMALDVAGSVDALLADEALLSLALDAAAEGRELGRVVGKAEAWASLLLRFVGPRMLRMGVGMARAHAPEAVTYAERHFGRKLHAQNVAMATRIIELARERGTPCRALEELASRLGSGAHA